ncbi:MAG: MarR family winged helix-turn-helix transcriptional regulator [Casimicrobium sp.]
MQSPTRKTLGSDKTEFDFHVAPGHLIRRAQQIAVAIFMEETSGLDLTPVQFALLSELAQSPDIDQVSLAAQIAVDVATLGQVALRLEARGLLVREENVSDRRRKRLAITASGRALIKKALPAIDDAQARILAPLSRREQLQFQTLLAKLVLNNNEASRAPMKRT